MADLDPSTPSTPIVVPDSPLQSQVMTLLRDLGVLLAALPLLLQVLGTHDLLQIINFLRSETFAPAALILMGGAVTVWRFIAAGRNVRKLQILERYAPDSVAITKTVLNATATDIFQKE